MVKITKEKKLIAIIILLIIIFSAISVTGYSYFQIQYGKVKEDYNDMLDSYDSIQNKYSGLIDNYNNLHDQYTDLNEEYSALSEIILQYNRLPIDHLMMFTYNEIREQVQPKYNPWWGSYYYDKTSMDYAALVCAHDLARRHWPSIENNYYETTGAYLCDEAYDRISEVIDIIGISRYDNNVDKIEKILNFISANIEYQSDLNNEFLFPVETITYKSGDCDDFSILAATLFEAVGIESAIGFFTNEDEGANHCMVLLNLPDLNSYGCWYYDDLTKQGLSEGRWIIIEPQATIERQHDEDLIKKWGMIAVAEVPNE